MINIFTPLLISVFVSETSAFSASNAGSFRRIGQSDGIRLAPRLGEIQISHAKLPTLLKGITSADDPSEINGAEPSGSATCTQVSRYDFFHSCLRALIHNSLC